jgi:hypothetical protein
VVSVIISSAKKDFLDRIKENIEVTIGVPFEIIAYDNSDGKKGICEIYNWGANKAKYDILCFSHEDIEFKTINWGKIVNETFKENPNLGIVGVVGSAYKSYAPSGWGIASPELDLTFSNYIQSYKRIKRAKEEYFINPNNSKLGYVVCVDGMWFCTTKKVYQQYGFDEVNFKGFHCYEIDYCLSVKQTHDVAVTFEVLLEHFSEGSYNKQWVESTMRLHEKWQNVLPLSTAEISPEKQIMLEKRAFKHLIRLLLALGYNYNYIYTLLKTFLNKKGSPLKKIFIKMNYYLIKYYFKKREKHLFTD